MGIIHILSKRQIEKLINRKVEGRVKQEIDKFQYEITGLRIKLNDIETILKKW